MAVYKSTRCYPFMNSVDIRVAETNASSTYPVQYFKCKVDTSNKNITGYKIRILDSENNQIFPIDDGDEKVSPISELQTEEMASLFDPNGTNSGVNGTYLQIPFFQNYYKRKTSSFNAVYYKPQYMVDYVIMDDTLAQLIDGNTVDLAMDYSNWTILLENKYIQYEWPQGSDVSAISGGSVVETQNEMRSLSDQDAFDVYYSDGTYNTAYDFDRTRNRIRLDSETLLDGQIILVAKSSLGLTGAPSGFYKVTKKINNENGNNIITTVLELVNNGDWPTINGSSNFEVVIKRGERFHNTILKCTAGNFSKYNNSTDGGLWCNYDGEDLSGFNISGNLYKWEITLYQGDGVVRQVSRETSPGIYEDYVPSLHYVEYENTIQNKDLDMVVNSGSILGSNSSRIQIASEVPFKNGIPNPDAILPGLKTGVLVLQGRYMDMSYSSGAGSNIFSGNRVYVQTYDSTYGHVYPISGTLDSQAVSSATHVQFFKYSNNAADIKAADTVEYGISTEIDIAFRSSDSLSVPLTIEQFMLLPINKRRYGIFKNDLPVQIRNLIQDGNKIILTGQGTTKPAYENGVYEVTESTDQDLQNFLYFKRAASYNTWSNYIGRILYCANYWDGSGLVSRNLESLADSGSSYNLWNPDSVNSGDSNIYFTQELPILLFEDRIKDKRTYDLLSETPVSEGATSAIIDGLPVRDGNLVLDVSGYATERYKVFRMENGYLNKIADSSEGENDLLPKNGDFCYFISGQKWGRRVLRIGGAINYNWQLHTALILKNTSKYTFLSPFIDVKKGMKIKLIQDRKVSIYQNGTTDENTSWISINSVNTNLFAISHGQLISPSALVSERSAANNTPWRYEIRSFFKTSDENPFYCYENPYLILYKNNLDYTSLANLVIEREFWVGSSGSATTFLPYYVLYGDNSGGAYSADDPDETYQFIVGSYKDSAVVYGKSVKLSAKYMQFDGISWESYRWTLADSEGNIVQDTGKKYDKNISVVFYGLSNDGETDYSVYYATLYVEDEIENILTYVIKIVVKAGEAVKDYFPFVADFDCNSHAVKLSYTDNSNIAASYRNENGDVDNIYSPNSFLWDNGVNYIDGSGFSVRNKGGNSNVLVYDGGSTIDQSDAINYSSLISLGEETGIAYYRVFNSSEESQDADAEKALLMDNRSSDSEHNGELYFETEFSLDDNYCGDILNWQIEGAGDSGVEEPYLKENGEMSSKIGYINFRLYTGENLDNSHTTLQSLRNKIILSVDTISPESGVDYTINHTINNINLFKIDGIDSKYYLQPYSIVSENNVKTDDYEYLRFKFNTELYLRRDRNGNYFCGGNKFLGNLCLKDSTYSSDDNFMYWVEDRPLLSPASDDTVADRQKFLNNTRLQFLKNADRTTGSESGILKWPDAESESNSVWGESTSYAGSPVASWHNVTADNQNVVKMVALSRHYGMSEYNYHVICRIQNVYSVYYNLLNSNLSITEEINGDSVQLSLVVGSSTLGTITIIKTQNEE